MRQIVRGADTAQSRYLVIAQRTIGKLAPVQVQAD